MQTAKKTFIVYEQVNSYNNQK